MDKFKSGGIDIEVEIFQPIGTGQYPAIVIAYGTRGLTAPFGDAIRDFAKKIADEGYFVAIPYYFERTGTAASNSLTGDALIMEAFSTNRDTWIETIQDCITHIASLGNVKNDQIGLLAFSMGGHLALRLSKSAYTPKINALVAFFAPITQAPFNGLGGNISELPPIQIHHGTKDVVVDKSQSEQLAKELESVGKQKNRDYEIFFYPGEGHGFSTPSEISTSTQRTIDFFQKYVN
jgi:dienelactone hydrolase